MADDVKKIAQDSKTAFAAGDLQEAARQLATVRDTYPEAEQGPNGEVMVEGLELSA
jgi:hypothetical protein